MFNKINPKRKFKGFLILLSLLLISIESIAHDENCPHITCFAVSPSMPSPCEEFNFFSKIQSGGMALTGVTYTLDYGDNSSPLIVNVGSMSSMSSIKPETTYVYSTPGIYTASLTVTCFLPSGFFCTETKTVSVTVTGFCEPCSTVVVLSTPSSWNVLNSYNLHTPSYTPIPSSVVNINSSASSSPSSACVPPTGNARPITVPPPLGSAPKIYTFRRSFTLSGASPGNMYSLNLKINNASDYIFDVQLNGISLMPGGGQPNSFQIGLNSCGGGLVTGANNLDIIIANTTGNCQFDAEAIVYECPCTIPCSSGNGWSYSYSWNTNWGYGWYYYWYAWYCQTYGSLAGGPCPPGSPPSGPGGSSCPSCSPGGGGTGTAGGWGWMYVSGYGWMWIQGGTSGSISVSCPNCIASFAPTPGKKYILSAWVKEQNPPQSKTSYNYPQITVLFPSISGSTGPYSASGNIIDGWQRIEAEFVIPATASDMDIKLDCTSSNCYFDDVRLLPFDGSMKSYVYDPVNMRLLAELDERNYATLYEYDEEGKLIRVKKETEKGKMTIKENRDNTKK